MLWLTVGSDTEHYFRTIPLHSSFVCAVVTKNLHVCSLVWVDINAGNLISEHCSFVLQQVGTAGECSYSTLAARRIQHIYYLETSSGVGKVAFLSIFQFFFHNLHDLPQKKTPIYRKKKVTRLDGFFVHELHFSLPNLVPNPQPRVQPNLLPRWQPSLQPSLQLESPFL